MTQVYRLGNDLFICLEKDISKLGDIKRKLGLPLLKNSLAIWPITSSDIELFDGTEIRDRLKVIRYLDHFYLLAPENPPHLRQLYINFFELIGGEYEALIDVNCNKENIENLLRLLGRYVNPLKGAKVIDYGCGTGLSLDIAQQHKINIVGFDPSPVMRHIAARREMLVWDDIEIAHQPYNSIDAAFSSYVFHFLSRDESLQILFKLLKPQGVLVANFHKNLNRDKIDKHLTRLGFDVSIPSNFATHKRHGSYVAYTKPK